MNPPTLSLFQDQFLSGDSRANENPGLQVMHTVWFREHNRLADFVAKAAPSLSDEAVFQGRPKPMKIAENRLNQSSSVAAHRRHINCKRILLHYYVLLQEARRLVVAQLQNIVYRLI